MTSTQPLWGGLWTCLSRKGNLLDAKNEFLSVHNIIFYSNIDTLSSVIKFFTFGIININYMDSCTQILDIMQNLSSTELIL